MKRYAILATMWNGAEVRRIANLPPTDAELDVIAAKLTPHNGGVRPTVRVVEHFSFR